MANLSESDVAGDSVYKAHEGMAACAKLEPLHQCPTNLLCATAPRYETLFRQTVLYRQCRPRGQGRQARSLWALHSCKSCDMDLLSRPAPYHSLVVPRRTRCTNHYSAQTTVMRGIRVISGRGQVVCICLGFYSDNGQKQYGGE